MATANLTSTAARDGFSASATTRIAAVLTATGAKDTVSSAAAAAIRATLSSHDRPDTLAGVGAVAITARLNATSAPDSADLGPSDMLARIRRLLPEGWFPDVSPVLDSLLAAPASALTQGYRLLRYAQLQTRIGSASDFFLDLIAVDFFGDRVRRRAGEGDPAFRRRILWNLFLERGTRPGMVRGLTFLTGFAPVIREPRDARDNATYRGPCGYRTGATYGSVRLPFQVFVAVTRPYPGSAQDGATDAEIYALIEYLRPEATKAWVRIVDPTNLPPRTATLTASGARDLLTSYASGSGTPPPGGQLDFSKPANSGLLALFLND